MIVDRVGAVEAWRRGIFCELRTGGVDLDTFLTELRCVGYSGWIVVEQDRVPRTDEAARRQRPRCATWLRERGF